MTKTVRWNGDMANEPKTGVAVINNGLAHITWSDGTKCVAPDFTLKAEYGWTLADA